MVQTQKFKKDYLEIQIVFCYFICKENYMIEKDGRIIEELPKNLNVSKKEFEKMFNLMTSKIKEKCVDDKKSELEEYAVVFALIQEFYLFLDRY